MDTQSARARWQHSTPSNSTSLCPELPDLGLLFRYYISIQMFSLGSGRLRNAIRAFWTFRCCGSKTCKNTCKCCTGATWRSKWPAPACSGAASALEGAVRACFSPAGALKMAALACPGAASALGKADRACLGAASAIKMAGLACSGVASVLKKAVRACFGAASALKEAFRACCSRSLFEKSVLG